MQITKRAKDERGFSLVELMIVGLITTMIAGAAVSLASQVQASYSYQLDDAAVQQEVRYAMDWITRSLAAAGNNAYPAILTVSACPAPGTAFQALRLDPDGDGIQDDVRIQSDINPPNALLGGPGPFPAGCTEQGEDVTIAHDQVNSVLTRFDRAIDAAPVAVTDQVFSQLRFTYLTTTRAVTVVPANIAYVQVNLTGRSRSRNQYTRQQTTFAYQSEVRVRAR